MNPFVHLHVHTQYSLLDGQASVKNLVDKALKDGMPAVAVTDHGNMFAIKEFLDYVAKANKQQKEAGLPTLKPIVGCEVYVARNGMDNKRREVKEDQRGWHLILLAKNLHGYKNLIKIVSRSWVNGYYFTPRTDHADLEKYHEDIICCSACLGGEIPNKILKEDLEGAEASVRWYREVFGEDFYLELQRHRPTVAEAAQDTYPKQVMVNEKLLELAQKYGIKTVASNDVHFVNEDDAEAHHRLVCVTTGHPVDDYTKMAYTKQEWFKTQEEMNGVFADLPEALANTLEVADKVETYSIDHDPIMPNFAIPEDFGTEDSYRQRFSEQDIFEEFTRDENGKEVMSEEEAKAKFRSLGGYEKLIRIKLEADYLGKLAYEGAKRLYGDPLSPEVDERIRFELHIMKTMGFPGYFLIVQDFINAAQKELGVWVGPGRGSAAGSAVAYCLGITKVDPIKYDLLFERFLNPDRISLPDIDVDFDDDGRGRVLQWVTDKYGAEKVAHIITYGTMATKSAIKDVARVQGLPLDKANALAKLIPDRLNDPQTQASVKINFKNCLKYVPELQAEMESPDPQVRETLKYAVQLEGNVRNTGVHACGTIICRDDISDWVPVSTADDKETGEKLMVTQYEGSVIESTGLIKMDFLGLKTLSILKEAIHNIQLSKGIDIDLESIPLDDELTYKLYSEGRTVGTFQFESPGMQKYLRELHPSTFEDLIAMNALYRPGPMDYIPDFIDRKLGRKPVEYDIPCMERYLKDTYGVTVYQEQVMLLSRQLAGFTRGQSDTLRKAMGKKLIDKMNHLEGLFYEGGEKNGHPKEVLQKIWEDWKKFASYAFNKSHATCYSLVAYQTAYLKAHYPAEYMAAVLTRSLGNIADVTKFMGECRAMGIPVLGPDINESGYHFTVNRDGHIRFGLAAIKDMGEKAVKAILETREKDGPFQSVFDLVERINLSAFTRKNLEVLAEAGALDSFRDLTREQYQVRNAKDESYADQIMHYGQIYQMDQNGSMGGLFDDEMDTIIERPAAPAHPADASALARLQKEKEKVGMFLSAHPLDDYYPFIRFGCNTTMVDYAALEKDNAHREDVEYVWAGVVTEVKEMMTKRGEKMARIKMEDYSGSAEVTFFPESHLKFGNFLKKDYLLAMKGRMESPKPHYPKRFTIVSVALLSQAADIGIHSLRLSMPLDSLTPERVTELTQELPKHPGSTALYFEFYDRDGQHKLHTKLISNSLRVSMDKSLMQFIDAKPDIEVTVNEDE